MGYFILSLWFTDLCTCFLKGKVGIWCISLEIAEETSVIMEWRKEMAFREQGRKKYEEVKIRKPQSFHICVI